MSQQVANQMCIDSNLSREKMLEYGRLTVAGIDRLGIYSYRMNLNPQIFLTYVPQQLATVKGTCSSDVYAEATLSLTGESLHGENGILLYGENPEHIQDICFRDIALMISKKTDWPRNEHDLRPTCGCEAVKDAPFFIYAKGSSRTYFQKLQTDTEGVEMPELFFAKDCRDFQIAEL